MYRNSRFVAACLAMLMVLAGCTGAAPPAGQTTPLAGAAAQEELKQLYQASVRAAAARTPHFTADLRTIDAGSRNVRVATFTDWGVPASPTPRSVWVSLPDQLQGFCRGKPDPVLAIQQALGLPPQAQPPEPGHHWSVVTFTVPRQAMFRPCPGGGDLSAARCGLAPIKQVTPPASPPHTDAAMADFLLAQLWNSHRTGFVATDGRPAWGYPFTGMGWSYNWDPSATSPVGVSEFVLRRGTTLQSAAEQSPGDFCAGSG